MTLAIIAALEAKISSLFTEAKAEVVAIEPEILAWATAFLADVTPVLKQAATDGVLAAISVPGTGAIKFAAAVAAATADLASKGIPVVENDIKAAVQIAYKALPEAVQANAAAQAVEAAAGSEIDAVAAKAEASASPTPKVGGS